MTDMYRSSSSVLVGKIYAFDMLQAHLVENLGHVNRYQSVNSRAVSMYEERNQSNGAKTHATCLTFWPYHLP